VSGKAGGLAQVLLPRGWMSFLTRRAGCSAGKARTQSGNIP
jgi:hypothetical protein